MKVTQLLEADEISANLKKGADALVAKGWEIKTNDPEGKRGDKIRQISLKRKSTNVRFAFDEGKYVFAFKQNGGGWGSMWREVSSSKDFASVMKQVEENLK